MIGADDLLLGVGGDEGGNCGREAADDEVDVLVEGAPTSLGEHEVVHFLAEFGGFGCGHWLPSFRNGFADGAFGIEDCSYRIGGWW